MLVITATGDASYQRGGALAHMNHLDPRIRTAFGFIGIRDIHFVGVSYDEFPDHRISRSLAAAEVTIKQLAGELARAWSTQNESISAVESTRTTSA